MTNEQSVQQAVAAALDAYDRIDVLVNNAGYGAFGAIEEFSADDIRQQFEVNFFGLLDVTRAVLPTMREQRSGHILNISSVGGFASFSGAEIYSASKFALEGASEALAQEVKPLGIKVTIIEPGAFRTAFRTTANSKPPAHLIADYAEISGKTRELVQAMDGKQPGDPVKAAAAMIQVVESDDPPLRLALGEDAVNGIIQKLESMRAGLEQWKDVSINTALEAVSAGL